MNLLQAVKDFFAPTLKDRTDRAIDNVSRTHGQVERFRKERNLYSDIVNAINPTQDWWGYADAKQSLTDSEFELERAIRRYHVAMDELNEVRNETQSDKAFS